MGSSITIYSDASPDVTSGLGNVKFQMANDFREVSEVAHVAKVTPTPESHVRKGMDEWLSGSEFRPPKERRNPEIQDAMAVRPWSFTKVALKKVRRGYNKVALPKP